MSCFKCSGTGYLSAINGIKCSCQNIPEFQPDIPPDGLHRRELYKALTLLTKELEVPKLNIALEAPEIMVSSLANICLKQQELIEVLENRVDSLEGIVCP